MYLHTLVFLINMYTRLSFCHFFPAYTLLLEPTRLLIFHSLSEPTLLLGLPSHEEENYIGEKLSDVLTDF